MTSASLFSASSHVQTSTSSALASTPNVRLGLPRKGNKASTGLLPYPCEFFTDLAAWRFLQFYCPLASYPNDYLQTSRQFYENSSLPMCNASRLLQIIEKHHESGTTVGRFLEKLSLPSRKQQSQFESNMCSSLVDAVGRSNVNPDTLYNWIALLHSYQRKRACRKLSGYPSPLTILAIAEHNGKSSDWDQIALQIAVDLGLLNGFEEDEGVGSDYCIHNLIARVTSRDTLYTLHEAVNDACKKYFRHFRYRVNANADIDGMTYVLNKNYQRPSDVEKRFYRRVVLTRFEPEHDYRWLQSLRRTSRRTWEATADRIEIFPRIERPSIRQREVVADPRNYRYTPTESHRLAERAASRSKNARSNSSSDHLSVELAEASRHHKSNSDVSLQISRQSCAIHPEALRIMPIGTGFRDAHDYTPRWRLSPLPSCHAPTIPQSELSSQDTGNLSLARFFECLSHVRPPTPGLTCSHPDFERSKHCHSPFFNIEVDLAGAFGYVDENMTPRTAAQVNFKNNTDTDGECIAHPSFTTDIPGFTVSTPDRDS